MNGGASSAWGLCGALLLGLAGCSLLFEAAPSSPERGCVGEGCDGDVGEEIVEDGGEDVDVARSREDVDTDAETGPDEDAHQDADTESCVVDADCPTDAACVDGRCLAVGAPCAGDADCPAPMVCREDRCSVAQGLPCAEASDCPAPSACQQPAVCEGGLCLFQPLDLGEPCQDGDLCTLGDGCDDVGRCVGIPKRCAGPDLSCTPDDTALIVTPRVCDPDTAACVPGPPQPPIACPACSSQCLQTCDALACEASAAENPCKRAWCEPGPPARCVSEQVPDGTVCQHVVGFPFTCRSGVCIGCDGGGVLSCYSYDPCINVTCVDAVYCTATWPSGVSCDDLDACTVGDRCDRGVCQGGPSPCGLGAPHCVLGVCYACASDQECDDGNACTIDQCIAGTCASHGDLTRNGQPCGRVGHCENGNCKEE